MVAPLSTAPQYQGGIQTRRAFGRQQTENQSYHQFMTYELAYDIRPAIVRGYRVAHAKEIEPPKSRLMPLEEVISAQSDYGDSKGDEDGCGQRCAAPRHGIAARL
jgi:hypothetical protein